MRATCARNRRDLRARRGHYVLRDLAGFADIERLLAADTMGQRHCLDIDTPANVTAQPEAARPRPSGFLRTGARI
jgi:hypothetical protein